MTASSLLPLAPKASFDQMMNLMNMPLPLVRPQSLLLYPDVLLGASVAETLMQRQARAQALQPPPSALLQTTMAFAVNYNNSQEQKQAMQHKLQQQLQHELHTIQASSVPPAKSVTESLTASLQQNNQNAIIGMGICIPSSRPTRKTQQAQSQSEAVKKMMMIGNPLRAPPQLAKKIYKRRTAPSAPQGQPQAPLAKRRKVSEGEPLAAPREIEFLQAVQRLHSPPSSPQARNEYPAPPLVRKALKPPPSLGL